MAKRLSLAIQTWRMLAGFESVTVRDLARRLPPLISCSDWHFQRLYLLVVVVSGGPRAVTSQMTGGEQCHKRLTDSA